MSYKGSEKPRYSIGRGFDGDGEGLPFAVVAEGPPVDEEGQRFIGNNNGSTASLGDLFPALTPKV